MFSLCHPWFTTTNLSYTFPILETSATASCGSTGIQYWIIAVTLGGSTFPYTKWPRPNLTPHTTFSCPACDQSFKGFFCQVQNGLNICLLDDVETRQRLPVVFSTEKCRDVMWVRLFTRVAETKQVLKKRIVKPFDPDLVNVTGLPFGLWWIPKTKREFNSGSTSIQGSRRNHFHPFPSLAPRESICTMESEWCFSPIEPFLEQLSEPQGYSFLLMYLKKHVKSMITNYQPCLVQLRDFWTINMLVSCRALQPLYS